MKFHTQATWSRAVAAQLFIAASATIFAPAANGDPVAYTITFDYTTADVPFDYTGSFAPTGSFTFDSSNSSAPFSKFFVTWNNIIFDLTASANDPSTYGGGCNSSVFALLSPGGACPHTYNTGFPVWSVYELPPGNAEFEFDDIGADNPLGNCTDPTVCYSEISIDAFGVGTPIPDNTDQVSIIGDYEIAPQTTTPEPSSGILMSTGLLAIAFVARKRMARG
jgi:hypothetical protein